MIAGTILVFGTCGIRAGAGMRRGTIGLFGADPPTMLPISGKPVALDRSSCGSSSASWPGSVSARLTLQLDADLLLYHGDSVTLGKGEVWMRAS